MDKAKKLVSAFRTNNAAPKAAELDIRETLSSSDFRLARIVRHGFPHDPKCMAFDPVQKLLAIGTGNGSIRIFGKPGVDCHLRHESDAAVIALQFLVNEGALISACRDDCVHLWNFRQKRPEIVHTIQFDREQITCVYLPLQSRWLHVGTKRGNVYSLSIQTFELSGYVINWNKAISIAQKNHPGAVRHLSECPEDDSKLLIGFEGGLVSLWSLKERAAEARFCTQSPIHSVCWHHDGKQFMCSHMDGTLSSWNIAKPAEATQVFKPHSPTGSKCRPITKVEWRHGDNGEWVIFAGGLPHDESGVLPAVTILKGGRSATMLEMEHPIVSFITLCNSPYANEPQDPYAIAVLLKKDFLIVDLSSNGYPCFENPYPMDVHESPVTCLSYVVDAPTDLIAAFYSVGSKQKRQEYSDKAWPLTGGEWGSSASAHAEIILTGHSDGLIKFWDASSENLHLLYKLKATRHYERPSGEQMTQLPRDFNLMSVSQLCLCGSSRRLAVATNNGNVTLFEFSRQEQSNDIPVLSVQIKTDVGGGGDASGAAAGGSHQNGPQTPVVKTRHQSSGSADSVATSDGGAEDTNGFVPCKVRGGPLRRPAGYQPDLVCVTPWLAADRPPVIRALTMNTAFGLMAYGTDDGIAIIDIVQHTLVQTLRTCELYGGNDPFSRPSRGSDPNAADDPAAADNGAAVDKALETQPLQKCRGEIGKSVQDAQVILEHQNVTILLLQTINTTTAIAMGDPGGSGGGSGNGGGGTSNATSGAGDRASSTSNLQTQAAQQQGSASAAGSMHQLAVGVGTPSVVRRATAHNKYSRLRKVASIGGCVASERDQQQQPVNACKLVVLTSAEKDVMRSRSSSASSQDMVAHEPITSLGFIETFATKNCYTEQPCLMVGTAQGSGILLTNNIATTSRSTQPVTTSTSASGVFRIRGKILCAAFLDKTGNLLTPAADSWKESKNETSTKFRNYVITKRQIRQMSAVSAEDEGEQPPGSPPVGDQHLLVLCSEKMVKVIGLPTHQSYWINNFEVPVCVAGIDAIRGSAALSCVNMNGALTVHSLPSLKPLLTTPLLSKSDAAAVATLCFSRHGHGAYLCTPSEIQKFTVDAELAGQITQALGELFQGCDMPEPPKPTIAGTFKSFFTGTDPKLDREELFGESRASKAVARYLPGSAAITQLRQQSNNSTNVVSKAHQQICERGEKLGEVEERTSQMMEGSRNFASNAAAMKEAMKQKRWYQM